MALFVSNNTNSTQIAVTRGAVRQRLVSVNAYLLASTAPSKGADDAGNDLVLLNLFNDAKYHAILDHREVRSGRSFVWQGHIKDVEHSQVTFVVDGDVVVGNVRVMNALYQVRYGNEHGHIVYEIDPLAFPQDVAPLRPGRVP